MQSNCLRSSQYRRFCALRLECCTLTQKALLQTTKQSFAKKISHTKMKDYNHVGDLLKVKNIGTFLRGKLKKKIYQPQEFINVKGTLKLIIYTFMGHKKCFSKTQVSFAQRTSSSQHIIKQYKMGHYSENNEFDEVHFFGQKTITSVYP